MTRVHGDTIARNAKLDFAVNLWPLIEGVTAWDSAANFLLAQVPDGPRVVADLRSEGIAARPAADFVGLGGDHLRICVRGQSENAQLVEALRRAVEQC